jgi:hypothetical protein
VALVIRLVPRGLAYLLLAAALATAVIDTTRSIENAKLVLISFEQAAAAAAAAQLGAFETLVKERLPEFLWDPVSLALLRLPASLVLAAVAVILFRLARPRRRKLEPWTD